MLASVNIEVWMQWVASKVNVTYFAYDPLHSYFDECQKNEIYLTDWYYKIEQQTCKEFQTILFIFVMNTKPLLMCSYISIQIETAFC